MKKKISAVVIIAAIAITAGWNYNQSQNEMSISDLALENVEALASGEWDRDDCEFELEKVCSELIIWSDGTTSQSHVLNHTKKDGWL